MKKEYDFSKLKEVKNPYAGKKKAVGINLSPAVMDYFKGLAEDGTSLPEVDRSLFARLREEAEETDDEVGGVAAVEKQQSFCYGPKTKTQVQKTNLGHPAVVLEERADKRS
jgi:hypothetical protein